MQRFQGLDDGQSGKEVERKGRKKKSKKSYMKSVG